MFWPWLTVMCFFLCRKQESESSSESDSDSDLIGPPLPPQHAVQDSDERVRLSRQQDYTGSDEDDDDDDDEGEAQDDDDVCPIY